MSAANARRARSSAGRLLTLLPALGLLAACAPRVDERAAQETLLQTSRDWAKAAQTGDIEKILGYWSDDAVVLAPGQPAIVGKPAIRAFVQRSMSIPRFSITWEPEQATIAGAGDLGYLVEHNRTTFADSTGALHTEIGKAVTIWRKNASGAWKCVVDTWNDNPTERVLPR